MKNKPGTKTYKFLSGEVVYCKNHGFHRNYNIYIKNSTLRCIYCQLDSKKRIRDTNNIKTILTDTKNNSRNKNIKVEITESDIHNLIIKQNNRCAISGIEFDENNRISLDRIIPGSDYTLSNVQLVVTIVNTMKWNIPLDRFNFLCETIANYSETP